MARVIRMVDGGTTDFDASTKTVGIIAPNKGRHNEVEFPEVCPDSFSFLLTGLRIGSVDADNVDRILPKVTLAAKNMEQAGADMVIQCGVPLGVVAGDDELLSRIGEATDLPSTTMSNAVVDSLDELGLGNVAVSSPYSDEMNAKLKGYLNDRGVDVGGMNNLEMLNPDLMNQQDAETIYELGKRNLEANPDVEGLFISCGGVPTLEPIVDLEAEFGKPVVSSAQASIWQCLRILDYADPIEGFGSLLDRPR